MGDKKDYLYNAMIYAWAKNKSPIAVQRAKRWFHNAENESIATTVTYNTMMHAYAGKDNMNSADCLEAERIFFRMIDRGVKPSNTTYSALMSIWSSVGDIHGVKKVLEWFKRHSEQSKYDPLIQVTNREYNIALIAVSKLVQLDMDLVRRARNIYREMLNSDNADIRPTTVTYGAMIKILSNSPLRNAWREALALLKDSIYLVRDDTDFNLDGLKPSGHAFSSVLNAMSNASSSNPEIAISADELMSLFNEVQDSYGLSMHPTILQNLMKVFSRSKNANAGKLAEKWIRHYQFFLEDSPDLSNRERLTMQQSYRMAIEALAGTSARFPDALQRALSLYAQAPTFIRENAYVMLAVIKVAANTKTIAGLETVEEFINQIDMTLEVSKKYTDDQVEYFKNIGRYYLMVSYAKNDQPCFDDATALFDIQQSTGTLSEGLVLRYLTCAKKHLKTEVERDEAIQRIFASSIKFGVLSEKILEVIKSLISDKSLASMQIPPVIPKTWKMNVNNKRRRSMNNNRH